MNFSPKHILVPVAIELDDDLMLAEHAVMAACSVAQKFSSKITLLHLASLPTPGGGAGVDISGKIYQSFLQNLQVRLEKGKAKLQKLSNFISDRGIAVEGKVIDSIEKTSEMIVSTAKELDVDLIVLGSHGRHGLSKLLFGSVAEGVASSSSIPVLLLHPAQQSGAIES